MTDRNYKARVDTFSSLLNYYTSLHPEFDTDQWRSYFKSLADRESDFKANASNKIKAYGYFQLMPTNQKRSKNNPNPGAQFEDVFDLTKANLNYLKNHMTPQDYANAQAMGIDIYGLAAGAHLGGAQGMLNYIRSGKNPQDYNGTKISYYARDFSQDPKIKTNTQLGNWSVEGQAVRFEDVANGTSVLTGDTPQAPLLAVISNMNNALSDENAVVYQQPDTTEESLNVWRSRIPKDIVIEETQPTQEASKTQDNNKNTQQQETQFKSLVRYGVPKQIAQQAPVQYVEDPLTTVQNVWDTYNNIYDELFSRDTFKERERALGGPINTNNPIQNFSYFKGQLPVVRYSYGGELDDSVIPSSNSVKPNLFYDGGDTMTSQFLDQVLADREAEQQRKEELASQYNFSPFYDGYTEASQQMNNSSKPNIFRRSDGSYFYSADGKDEVDVTPVNTLLGNPSEWTYTDDNGRLYTPKSIDNNNQGVITQGNNEGPIVSAVNNYLRELQYKWDNNIPIDGKYTMPAIAASALLPLAGAAFANTTLASIPATTWADGALTAGFGAHGLNHWVNEGIDGWGDAAMTAMEIAPLGGLVKPMWNAGRESYSVGNRYFKGLFNKTKKAYKRFTEEPTSPYILEDEYHSARHKMYTQLAHEKADYPVYISKKEKDAFRKMYARQFKYSPASEVDTFDYSVFNYTDEEIERLKALFKHNPEYFVHVKDTGISNPLSQDAVDGFINRQLTSMRGVTAPNKETAIPYLTTTERGRYLRGGDRLSTNGGLYTTNNPVVSDRFKNPIGEINNNGYVGILKEPDTIDRTLYIEDQLRQLRNRTEFGDDLLEGTPYIHNLDRSNAKMFEAQYVGRASRGTGGYERAYLPTGKYGEVTSPVQLQSLEEHLNQADQHGRWGYSLDAKINPDLFIAKQLNGYDDYIRRARAVLKPRKETDWDVFNVEYNRLYEPAAQRQQRRRDLINKAYDKHRTYIEMKSQAPRILGMSSPVVGLFGYASYLRDENERVDELIKKYTENGMLRYGENGEPKYVLTDKGKINTPSDLSQLVEDFKERHQSWLERNQSRNKEKKQEYSLGGFLNKFEEGGNTDDSKYQAFLEDLKNHAPNLANPSRDYNMRRYWELRGKPSNWTEAQRDFNYLYNVKEDPMFTLEDDGSYHAKSVALNQNTGIIEFMKSADHPTVKQELNWYDNGDETMPNGLRIPSFEGFKSSQDFKQNYELQYSPIENKYYYIPKQR